VQVSIITPSFRNCHWLKLCIASVADQQGVKLEHIVQDSCSDDGTQEWLPHDSRVRAFIEKDRGMYDAVNRGLKRAQGEILAYLNCDEQYLPGALAGVVEFFERHPRVDVVFGDFVVVNDAGKYLFHRKVQTPLKYHTWTSHLATFTCATFFRRRLVDEGFWFNPGLRDVGDGEWMLRLLRGGMRMAVMRQFTSAFTMTGVNMSTRPNARREAAELFNSAPLLARKLQPLLVLQHRLRRLLGGIYQQKPFSYSIYSLADPRQRVKHEVAQPRFKWSA
jgi:glycosyltransferase involved in cell wall biosynthesis